MKKVFLSLSSAALLVAATTGVHATPLPTDTFTEASGGQCCFVVTLTQETSKDINVSVTSPTSGFDFAGTGSGQHPTFAFNLDDAASVTLVNPDTTDWTAHNTSVTTGGSAFGTFSDYFQINSGGTSAGISTLSFDVTVGGSNTIGFSDFVKSTGDSGGYYFEADFGINRNTANAGINTRGVTPEPSSLLLLGTGVLGSAFLLRRRMKAAPVRT